MTTERLYFADPLLTQFTARVVAHAASKEKPTVVLDRSAFYPESGGQMADRGTLGGFAVVDVQIDGEAVVHHFLDLPRDAPLPAIGTELRGSVEIERRRSHMALHSAQHLLSRALLEVAGAETVSSRLGESACTIDVDAAGISDQKLAEAEATVNRVVDEDRAVRAFFPTDEELATLELRRAPKQTSGIRVVDLGGFDVSPCGGTHVTRTAQIGLFRLTGSERYKGGTRVTFGAGSRARGEAHEEWLALGRAAQLVSTPRTEVAIGIERLKERLRLESEAAGRLRSALAERIATDAEADAQGQVFVDLGDGGVELGRQVVSALCRRPGRVAVVRATIESGAHLIITRSEGATVDCGALLRRVATAAGGKGGGRPEHAEGRIPADFDVRAALTS